MTWREQVLKFFGLFAGIIFLPTSVLLVVGMMPTVVAVFVTSTKKRAKAVTVGAMNLAGCTPFLLDLWMRGHNFETTFEILMNPIAIIVMYAAACIGYLIDWLMVGFVSGVMYQKAEARLEYIAKRQEDLVERWGKEVTGHYVLDEEGFALEEKAGKNEDIEEDIDGLT